MNMCFLYMHWAHFLYFKMYEFLILMTFLCISHFLVFQTMFLLRPKCLQTFSSWCGSHIKKSFFCLKKPGTLLIKDLCSTLSLKQKLICKSGLSHVPKSVNSTSRFLYSSSSSFVRVIIVCASSYLYLVVLQNTSYANDLFTAVVEYLYDLYISVCQ